MESLGIFDTLSEKLIEHSPRYKIGDIIKIISTDSYWLIEDINGFEYCFRILDNDTTRRDSIFYIDSHTNIVKVA